MSKKKTNEDKEIPGNLNDSSDSLAADFEVPAFDDADISVDKPLSDIPDAPVKDEVLFGSADEPDLSFPDFTSDPFLSSDPTTEEKASDNFLSDIDIGMDSPAENTSQDSERNFKISKEADEFDLPDIGQIDTSSLELPSFQDTFNETPEDTGSVDGSDTAGADAGLGDLDLSGLDTGSVDGSGDLGDLDLSLPETDVIEENEGLDLPDTDAAGESSSLADIDLPVPESDISGADSGLGEFDLPDLDADTADAGSSVDTGDGLGDFDLPDFGDSGLSEQPAASASTGAVGLGGIFDDDFGEVNLENNDTSFDDSDLTSPGFDPTDFGSDDGLETQAAQYDDLSDGEETERKSKVPVILIILIAILCLLGGSFLGFMFGRNLKKAKSETNTVTNIEKEEKSSSKKEVESETSSAENPVEVKPETEEKSSSVQPAESESSKKESAESVEKAPAAVEDQIVIASVPEAVVPEQPPKPETRPEDIRYTVKWGDTLWDIAEAYYKNPWRYTTIAKYNGLKNPDKIVAGSTLLIPAE